MRFSGMKNSKYYFYATDKKKKKPLMFSRVTFVKENYKKCIVKP